MAGSKIERLIAIIFLLINREKMTAKELSDYFSVSVKTIYRDIETLSLANIPVTSFAGSNGGYGILKDYIVDKNTFSYQEIVSALSVLGSISSFFNDPGISVAAEKITALIDKDKKDEIKKLAGELVFDLSAWGDSEPTKRKINIIREAIQNRNLLAFNYTNRSGESLHRTIEPISLLFKERAWYMKGYCRVREDIRTFKLTRISNLQRLEEKYVLDESKYDMEKVHKNSIRDPEFIEVIMKISPDIRAALEDQIDAEKVYEENGELFAKVYYPDDDYLYNLILGFGSKVRVIEPPYVRDIILERAKKVIEMYNEEESYVNVIKRKL